jgi:hypothetical protein
MAVFSPQAAFWMVFSALDVRLSPGLEVSKTVPVQNWTDSFFSQPDDADGEI